MILTVALWLLAIVGAGSLARLAWQLRTALTALAIAAAAHGHGRHNRPFTRPRPSQWAGRRDTPAQKAITA